MTNETADPRSLAEARYHLEASDGESALQLLDEAAPEAALSAEGEILRARAQLLAGAPDDAARSLLRAGRAGAQGAEIEPIYQALVEEGISRAPHARLLTWLVEAVPDAALALTLARLQMRRKRPVKAAAAAQRAIALDPGLPAAHRLAYVAALRSDQPQQAIAAIRGALDSARANPRFPGLKATMLGLPSEEARSLSAALNARWPGSLAAGAATGDLADDEGGPSHQVGRAHLMALEGDTEGALALARSIREQKDGVANSVREAVMEDVLRAIPGPQDRRRPLLVDEGREVTRSGPSLNGVTLLAFTNLTHRLNYDHEVIDAFCARTGAASMILRDFSYRLFIGGISELGPDRDSTIAALREELKALGTERLIVVGASAGAVSALNYGRQLGAARINGLGLPSSIDSFLRGDDTRVRALIEKLKDSFPPEDLDMRQILARAGGDAPIDLHFGADRRIDRAHAEYVQDLPGVTLRPIEGHADHQVLPKLIAAGEFQSWLEA